MSPTMFEPKGWKAMLLITAAIACGYAGAIQLNNQLLFNWLEFDRGRFLIFVPAGLKFLLLMCLRSAAVPGLILGITVASRGMFPELSLLSCLVMGVCMTSSAMLALSVGTRLLKLSFPWVQIHKGQLLLLVAIVAVSDSVASQWILAALHLDTLDGFVSEASKSALGRIAGSILVLAAFVWLRKGTLEPRL